jgi:hypothetical protein
MSVQRSRFRSGIGAIAAAWLAAGAPADASVRDPFPDPRPATQAAAVALVAGEVPPPQGCLTPRIQSLQQPAYGRNPTVLRALASLEQRSFGGVQEVVYTPEGVRIIYTTDTSGFDAISPADADSNGRPDLLDPIVDGLGAARDLLVDRLGLPAPTNLQVALLELGPGVDGYSVSRSGLPNQQTIVLDASPNPGAAPARRAAIHQYAHAVARAAGPRFPTEWGEALATWATLALDGGPDTVTAGLLSERIERLADGLTSEDLDLAPGNALWFAFLEQAHGLAAVRVTVQELTRPGPVELALDRALRRVAGRSLAEAFREFHLWAVLVGHRADRHHFGFASRLSPVPVASEVDGLPALSVLADPAVAVWGATQVRIRPGEATGGLQVRFEGEFGAGWEADLLLFGTDGARHRVPVEANSEGQGQITVPLAGLEEALLLIRSLGGDDSAPRRYTYAAHSESGYPFDLTALEAAPATGGRGVDVAWQTASEQELIGFNILRIREAGGSEVVVNPVWIPALGDLDNATSYRYLDLSAEPGTAYLYRVQGITKDGLTSLSRAVPVERSSAP